MDIAKLLSSIYKLGYDITDASYKVIPVENLVRFNNDSFYFEKLSNGYFKSVSTDNLPIKGKTYYQIEEISEEESIDALLKEYERFFGITPSSAVLQDRYDNYEATEAANFLKLKALENIYKSIGISSNNIYYNNNGVYTKEEKPTLEIEENFANAVLGLDDNLNFAKRILELNSEDTLNIYTDVLLNGIFKAIKDYIYYTNENVVFEQEDTLISILGKINKNVIENIEGEEDKIIIHSILSYVESLEQLSIELRLEKIKEALVNAELTPEQYFTDNGWNTSDGSVVLTPEQKTKNLNILEELFNGKKLSTFTAKTTKDNAETYEKYNFIDLTAVNRLKTYIDEYLADYLSKEIYSNNTNLKLNEINNKLSLIIKEIYNSSNVNSESNFKVLSNKIKNISTTLQKLGYNISPTYNVNLPKSSNNNTYIFSNKEGKASIGYFSEIVEPGDPAPVTSRAVYESTKLYHKNGDYAGFGKIERQNIKLYEKIFDKTNVMDKLSTVPLDYNHNNVPYISISNDDFFTILNVAKIIYIPIVRGGTINIELYEDDSSIENKLILAKNQESLFEEFNLSNTRAFIKGTYENQVLTFVFDDDAIFKQNNGVSYIALLNKGFNFQISKISYLFSKDNALRIDEDGILVNKEMTFVPNSFIGRTQNDETISDIRYLFSNDTELNSLV